MNDLYQFDTTTSTWTLEEGLGDVPPLRSFHAMASDGQRYLYIFGGCGESGRLNDLYQSDTQEHKWEQLPSSESVQVCVAATSRLSCVSQCTTSNGFAFLQLSKDVTTGAWRSWVGCHS